MTPFNSHIFDVVELDTDILTPQIVLVAQVGSPARYRGIVTGKDGATKTFSLVVNPSPAEPSVSIDLSKDWGVDPTFSVAENGYVIASVLTGQGGFTLRIFNDSSVLLDNKSLKLDQIVVVRVLRPGKHVISDQVGGGSCSLTVGYPMREHALAKDKLDLYVRLNGDSTEMDPKAITSSVAQAIAIHVQDKTRIVTTMAATFDRVGTKVVTNPYKKKEPVSG